MGTQSACLQTHTRTLTCMGSWFCVPQGFERTGLGERIANSLLTVCGSNSLGLAVGLAAAEVLVCPTMPSTTSRAAGIFMPVITSVSKAAGSYPGDTGGSRGDPCLLSASILYGRAAERGGSVEAC